MTSHPQLRASLIWQASGLEPYKTVISQAIEAALAEWSAVLALDGDATYEMTVLGADMSAAASGRSLASSGTGLTSPDGEAVLQDSLMVLVQEGRDVTPSGPDAEMTFSYSYLERYRADNGDVVTDELIDLAAHEIGHQLGFNTFASDPDFASIWDTFVEVLADGAPGFAGPAAVRANDGEPVRLEGSEPYQLTHFFEGLHGDEVMSTAMSPDESIGPLTVAAMRDLGFAMRVGEAPAVQATLADLIAAIDKAALDQVVRQEAQVRDHPDVPDLQARASGEAATDGGDLAAFVSGSPIDLGRGRDVLLLNGTRESWAIEVSRDGWVALTPQPNPGEAGTPEATIVDGVETLRFRGPSEYSVADDEAVHVGGFAASEMARLYAAVFGREPDGPGLDFWIRVRDGGTPAPEIARGFMGSQEYQARYGTDLSDQAFLDALYDNVLGRKADSEGNAYWLGVLRQGEKSRADVLLDFGNSAENVNNTQHYIADLSQDRFDTPEGVAVLGTSGVDDGLV